MYGMPLKEKKQEAFWGARAIFAPRTAHPLDILHDRQTWDGPERERKDLHNWLNVRGLPRLQEELKKNCIERDSAEIVEIREFKYVLRACPNQSHGYLYIGAAILPALMGIHKNSATGKDEHVFMFEGLKLVWGVDWDVPMVGQKGNVNVNSIGPATVVGYKHDKYVDDLMLLCPVVEIENPPQWMLDQQYASAVEKAEISGKKKPLKKDWKMGPISVHDGAFRYEATAK